MAPNNETKKGFFSSMFGGRKRAAAVNSNENDDENSTKKKRLKPSTPTRQEHTPTKRSSATKLVITEEWDDSSEEEEEVTVPKKSTTHTTKRKKRLPPSKLYPVKIAQTNKATLDSSDSDDTFATASDLSPKKKSATPMAASSSVKDKESLKETSTTPETFSADSQDDSSNKEDQAQRQAVSNKDEPEEGATMSPDKDERNLEKPTTLAKKSDSSPSTSSSSSSSSSDDDSSNDEAETVPDRIKRSSPASASDSSSSSSSSDDDSSNDEAQSALARSERLSPASASDSSSSGSSDSEDDSDEETSKQARLPVATKKRTSEPLKTVDVRDCSQQTVLTSNTKKRARLETVAEEEEESTIPTIDIFQTCCWKCRATLQLEDGEFCLYAMHTHPLFKVPICSVCADDVLGVELDSAAADPTQCSGCGLDEEDVTTLLLCDECPRAFCGTCVACSHGGGTQGMKQVKLLSNTDETWSCPFCKPPEPLQSLQSLMERIGEEKEDESEERTVETILLELEKVEAERKECEYQMSREVLAEKSKEVGAELRMGMKLVPMEEIDDAVEEEMEDWKLEWRKHDQRLSDRVVSLQEEIEMRGENLAGCYAAILGETKVDSDEPEWKKAADAEIQRRKDEEEDADDISLQNPSHKSVYEKDIPEDIEDLGISDPGENENKHSVWRSGRRRAKAKDMQAALKKEDKMLQQRDIPVLRVVDDAEDVEEVKEEEVLTSGRADDGASRIRRDGYQLIVRQRAERARRTRTERPKKKHRASTSVIRNARGPNRQDGFDANDDVSDLSDNDSVAMPSNTSDDTFDNSVLVLSSPKQTRQGDESNHSVRTVAIAASLASKLKAHQVSGVEFMWKQCFADLAYPDPPADVLERVGGCILAHNMGLGKSLTCISLLHALLKHPSLVSRTPEKKRQRSIRTVLLVVPTNVIAHWKAEIDQWTGQLESPIPVFNLGALHPSARPYEIKQWKQKGGILLISLSTFSSLVKKSTDDEALLDPGPDVIVADEAHLMLKKSTNNIFNALAGVKTRRRIVLTGSPFQNNLLEYYRLVSWARPGILGNSESTFEKEYGDPIMNGLSSDALPYAVRVSHEKSKKLNQLIGPFMQRRDVSTLRKELPPIQEVVLHVRQSRTQSRLYRAFASYKKRKNITNFFKNWQMIRPLHNHPGTLLLKEKKEKKNGGTRDSPDEKSAAMEVEPEIVEISTDTEEEAELLETASTSTVADDGKGCEENVSPLDANGADKSAASKMGKKASSGRSDPVDTENWWQKTVDRHGGVDKMNEVEQGYKIVLLLHILVEAQAIGDKVLVFSQCLRTLDFLEHVLGLDDWTKHVPSLSSSLPATGKRGGWVKGRDYLRIDGETNFSDRGDLIARFNDGKSSPSQGMKSSGVDEVKAFFLSSMACGIGINLVAANRVVLFDNHFNPTIMTQALYRSYRYGQTKPVFAYRFMTEGSVEEKIYSRSVNKTGVSLRVIDNKSIARNFTERELRDLEETDTWVQCDSCEKWRMLPREIDEEDLPKEWYCEMNEHDEVNASCDASEKDRAWYYRHLLTGQVNIVASSPSKGIKPAVASDSSLSLDETSKLEKDVILKKLLTVTASDQQSSVISKHYFHNDLLAETEEKLMDDEAFAAVTAAVEESANGDNSSITKAPLEVPMSTQPTRVSLCESVDKIFVRSPSSTSIGDIMNSLQAEYGVKFDEATKAFVRKRLKELLFEKSDESPTSNGDDESSTTTTTNAAKPPPPAEEEESPNAAKSPSSNVASVEESVETAESKAKTPPCTPRKKMQTSASSSSGTPSKKATSSPPAPSRTHTTAASQARTSPLKKFSDVRPSRKQSDSPPHVENEEEQGPLSPPRGEKSPENEDSSSSSSAQAASSPDEKPSGRNDVKQAHPNLPEENGEKEQEPISPHRARRSLGSASSLRQASSLPEVIEILSDSEDAADAAVVEDVVEILD